MKKMTAFVLKGYPRISETFIAQEILALERAGMNLVIVSLRKPTDKNLHPVHREISAQVLYLPEYLRNAQLRVLLAWWQARRLPGYRRAFRAWLADLKRDFSRNRIRRWGQALVMAVELPENFTRFHSHFLHTPASVTRYAALCRQVPWSASAHAKDIWTSPDWELAEKLESADWTVTCTRYGWEHLKSLAKDESKVHLVYHGLDLERFSPPDQPKKKETTPKNTEPVNLLSVGRAVEKKGFDVLVAALALLPENLNWHWTHIGGGELINSLKQQAIMAGIDERISWLGSQPQEKVLQQYRTSDIFLLPCRVARDGDRDGLPNVLVEAQSQALACISTPISGVPELIEDGVNGLLAESENAQALAAAIRQLSENRSLRVQLGKSGLQRVHDRFSHEKGIAQLLDLFGEKA